MHVYYTYMNSLFLLGRQPALGLAELESLYGPSHVMPVFPNGALVDIEPPLIPFSRLGGSVKLTRVLRQVQTTDWRKIEAYLYDLLPKLCREMPEGKVKIGISTYGLRLRASELNSSGLRLKKTLKAEGYSVRVVPNKSTALNSAQVLHNSLTGPNGIEIIVYRSGNDTYLCRTYAEQDIDAYAKRDQNRPMRDAKVGMLPPKLAQILINLANPAPDAVVLDPFCGTGVLLQEAVLMGFGAYGSDIEPRMITYSQANLDWLHQKINSNFYLRLESGDATTHTWKPTPSAVAAETFLGKPLSKEPSPKLLQTIMAECDRIHRGTLDNLARQLKPGTKLCLAVPAWKVGKTFKHLKTLDYLRELGYTRMEFRFAKASDLVYFREDQIVARELVVLQKN